MRFEALVLLLSCATASTSSFAAEIADHAAVDRYPGSVLTRRDNDGFRAYKLVTGSDPAATTDESSLATLSVDGVTTRLAYENPVGRSGLEIFGNYREALEAAGFQILFACSASECGPSYASSRWSRVTGLRYATPEMSYLAAKSTGGAQDLYVAILVAKRRHQVEVVEVKPMERGLVTARALAEGLASEGSVVLDGIFFDTDRATIRADSKPVLEVVAGFLAANATLQAFIVGYTD